jgi:hypothetical protein
VPIDIRYEPKTQKKFCAVFCSLKNYENIDLPPDIIKVVAEKLLNLHEYDLIS